MTMDPFSSEGVWDRNPPGAGSTLPGAPGDVPPTLYAHLRTHVGAEQEMLNRYAALVESSPSEALRYLMTILLEDEKRHHQLFRDMSASADAEGEVFGTPVVPEDDLGDVHDQGVVDTTEELLAEEKRDAHELRGLMSEMRQADESHMWRLLIELMEYDTKKHIAILRYAKRHLGRP